MQGNWVTKPEKVFLSMPNNNTFEIKYGKIPAEVKFPCDVVIN